MTDAVLSLMNLMTLYQYEKLRVQYQITERNNHSVLSLRRSIVSAIDNLDVDVNVNDYLKTNIHPFILDTEFVIGTERKPVSTIPSSVVFDIYYRLNLYFYNMPRVWTPDEQSMYMSDIIEKYQYLKTFGEFERLRRCIYRVSNRDPNIREFLETH